MSHTVCVIDLGTSVFKNKAFGLRDPISFESKTYFYIYRNCEHRTALLHKTDRTNGLLIYIDAFLVSPKQFKLI